MKYTFLLVRMFLAMAGLTGYSVYGQPYRESDALLDQPALQHIVDLQTQRDSHALERLLNSSDAAVRARAAFALASVQDSSSIAGLLTCLGDAHAAVRADAAFALGQNPGRVPSTALIARLEQENDPGVQASVIDALGKQGDGASLERLVTLPLGDSLFAAVALSIGRYGLRGVHATEAIAYLLRLLKSGDAKGRERAAYYFGRVQEPAPWSDYADTVRSRLDALQPDDAAAMHLLLGLNRLEDPRDTQRFVRWLWQATDWRIRTNAARALSGRTEMTSVREALFEHLDDPSEHVAVVAAEALARAAVWDASETQRVRAYVEAHPQRWRVTAALLPGLAMQGEEEVVLAEVSKRATSPLSYAASLPALAGIGRREAFETLAQAAHSPDARVAYAALEALGQRWTHERETPSAARSYYTLFADGVRRRDLATVYVAAPLLADSLFRRFGVVRLLMDTYRMMQMPADIEPMTAILGALGQAGDVAAAGLLQTERHHAHPVIRRAAADALLQLTHEPVPIPEGDAPAERAVAWAYLQGLGRHPRLVLDTDKGRVVVLLDAEQAPLTTQTLAQLAGSNAFDGVPFHRVVPNFVIQGGDFERRDGFGGPGYPIRSELTRIPFVRGSAGMASAGKDTEGSQYFITHSMQPHLDGRYTAFGYVLEGIDVVDRLYQGDTVVKATVEPGP